MKLVKLRGAGSDILVNVDQIVAIEALRNTTWTGKPKPGAEYKDTIKIYMPNGKSLTISGEGVLRFFEYLKTNEEVLEFPGMEIPLFSIG